MRPAAVKILAALAICGLTAFAATASGGTSAGPFGVGLKLGKVVNKITVGSSIGPWLVWNAKSCAYEVASKHPKAYLVRTVTNLSLAHGHAALGSAVNVFGMLVANSVVFFDNLGTGANAITGGAVSAVTVPTAS